MACDSLYAAWLKVHHPYEFYAAMLRIYTEKGNTEKIAAISAEMSNYLGISVTAGKFGQDNSDWFIDKENKRIAQNISSVKFISSNVSKSLLSLSKRHYDTFTDLLRAIQMETNINTKQLEVLIKLNYFSDFGKTGKLYKVFDHFFNSDEKLTKSYVDKTVQKRLEANRLYEESLPDEDIPIENRIAYELEYIGRCISKDPNAKPNMYYVLAVDDVYGVKVTMYSVQRGNPGVMKLKKHLYRSHPIKAGDLLYLNKFEKQDRFAYMPDGTRRVVNGVQDNWMLAYTVVGAEPAQAAA